MLALALSLNLSIAATLVPAVPLAKARLCDALSWRGAKDADGYRVYWGSGYATVTDVGAATMIELADVGITRNGVYRVAVTAYNEAGESRKSKPILFKLRGQCPL